MPITFSKDAITRLHDVAETFLRGVNAFNTQDWDTIEGLLDDNVIVYNVENTKYIIGKDKAMGFFRSQPSGATADQFWPITQDYEPSSYPVAVSGQANWTDYDSGHQETNIISYWFIFHPVSFKFLVMWASRAT